MKKHELIGKTSHPGLYKVPIAVIFEKKFVLYTCDHRTVHF